MFERYGAFVNFLLKRVSNSVIAAQILCLLNWLLCYFFLPCRSSRSGWSQMLVPV